MADKKNIGLYWGANAFHFIESSGHAPVKIFSIPFQSSGGNIKGATFIPEGLQLITNLQQGVANHKLSSHSVHLSLPTKDIIFRSFVVPWMQSHEIKGVVDFEVTKYIPFALDELSYSFHPITVTQDGTRRIRIIFVAIKKDALEHYTKTLEQANLKIESVEPSALSLIRSLISKNYMPLDQTLAVVEKGETAGKIIIVDQGVPQFVREFQMKSSADTEDQDIKALRYRLFNEIRISLDYYNRQDNQLDVKKIILLTTKSDEDFPKGLETDLGIPLQTIHSQMILGQTPMDDVAFLNAFGASLSWVIPSAANFNLSDHKSNKPVRMTSSDQKASLGKYASTIITLLVCTGITFATYLFSSQLTKSPIQESSQIKTQLGIYQDADTTKLQEENTTTQAKLDNYKNLRLKSEISAFLDVIPKLLPEGVWVKSLDFSYQDISFDGTFTKLVSKKGDPTKVNLIPLSIILEGYAYSENSKEEFGLVSNLVKNITENKQFLEAFENIDLGKVQTEVINDKTVTSFRITCNNL